MRSACRWMFLFAASAVLTAAAQTGAADPNQGSAALKQCASVTDADARAACESKARGQKAASPTPVSGATQAFPFPTEDSRRGGDAEGTVKAAPPADKNAMPGADADPPAESEKPLPGYKAPPAAATPDGVSSSSSNSAPDPDEDVAPTVPAGDTPVKAAPLKDLGSHADISGARAKLEANRVPDDLKIGRFYLQSGNAKGAYMRFKDAVEHDPKDPDARFGLAEAAQRLNNREEAVASYQECLRLDPGGDHDKEARKALQKLGAPAVAAAHAPSQ